MTYLQKSITFSQALNKTAAGIATQFNAFFGTLDKVNIQGAPFAWTEGDDLRVKIVYAESDITGGQFEMRYYANNGVTSAQDQYNADFAAGLNRVPMFFLDVTNRYQDQFLVIMAITDRGVGLGGDGLTGVETAVFVGEPGAKILAGATGAIILYDANGNILDNAQIVQNISATDWEAGERSLVFYDKSIGGYVGIPTCCGVGAIVPAVPPGPPAPVEPCPTVEVPLQEPDFT